MWISTPYARARLPHGAFSPFICSSREIGLYTMPIISPKTSKVTSALRSVMRSSTLTLSQSTTKYPYTISTRNKWENFHDPHISNGKKMKINSKYRLLIRVSAIVIAVLCAKLVIHFLGWEVISINPLFSGIVAANIFLMGFLLNGVLSDFKESERLPGELSACLENLAQEVSGIRFAKPEANVSPCLILLSQLSNDILSWFHKKHQPTELMGHVNSLTPLQMYPSNHFRTRRSGLHNWPVSKSKSSKKVYPSIHISHDKRM